MGKQTILGVNGLSAKKFMAQRLLLITYCFVKFLLKLEKEEGKDIIKIVFKDGSLVEQQR
jgi:hypothetical protein